MCCATTQTAHVAGHVGGRDPRSVRRAVTRRHPLPPTATGQPSARTGSPCLRSSGCGALFGKLPRVARRRPRGSRTARNAPRPTRRPHAGRHLTAEDDVVECAIRRPAHGRAAVRGGCAHGRRPVGADPGALAEKLEVRHINARTIADWQSQTRLVCDLPGLKSAHAQLLVGAGFRTFERLLAVDAATLQVEILRFAATPDGRRSARRGAGSRADRRVDPPGGRSAVGQGRLKGRETRLTSVRLGA